MERSVDWNSTHTSFPYFSPKATVKEIREENGEQLVELELVSDNQDGTAVVTGHATARIDS